MGVREQKRNYSPVALCSGCFFFFLFFRDMMFLGTRQTAFSHTHFFFFSKLPNTDRVSPGFYLSPRLSSGGRTWAGSYREGGTPPVLSAATAACYIDESRYSESPLPTSPPVCQMDLRLLWLLRAHFCGFYTSRRTNGTTFSLVLLFVSGIEPDRAVVTLPLHSRLKLKCLIAC